MSTIKQKCAAAALAVVLALCLCACSGEPESSEALPTVPSASAQSVPNAPDAPATETEPRAGLRTPLGAETVDDLIEAYRAEYAALDDEQRAGVVNAWSRNDFRFETPDGIISLYSASLSREAAAVLMLCNARACVDYVAQSYQGKPEYLTNLQTVYNEAAAELIALWNEPLTEDEFTNEMLLKLHEVYRKTAVAGDKESREGGTTYILRAVRAYAETQGAQDAEAFFQTIDKAS